MPVISSISITPLRSPRLRVRLESYQVRTFFLKFNYGEVSLTPLIRPASGNLPPIKIIPAQHFPLYQKLKGGFYGIITM